MTLIWLSISKTIDIVIWKFIEFACGLVRSYYLKYIHTPSEYNREFAAANIVYICTFGTQFQEFQEKCQFQESQLLSKY